MARVGLDGEVRAAERLDAEVALGARVLAQGARLEAAAVVGLALALGLAVVGLGLSLPLTLTLGALKQQQSK